ncbi:hypothetical protein GQ600_2961 [Phytophthora cactorum]|nr:hypothetical protein GQ600_2961 [Phytophthora cactorum]
MRLGEELAVNWGYEYLDLIENGTAERSISRTGISHAFGHDVYGCSSCSSPYGLQDEMRTYNFWHGNCSQVVGPQREERKRLSIYRFGRLVVSDVTVGNIDKENYPHFHEAKPVYVIQSDDLFLVSPSRILRTRSQSITTVQRVQCPRIVGLLQKGVRRRRALSWKT